MVTLYHMVYAQRGQLISGGVFFGSNTPANVNVIVTYVSTTNTQKD